MVVAKKKGFDFFGVGQNDFGGLFAAKPQSRFDAVFQTASKGGVVVADLAQVLLSIVKDNVAKTVAV